MMGHLAVSHVTRLPPGLPLLLVWRASHYIAGSETPSTPASSPTCLDPVWHLEGLVGKNLFPCSGFFKQFDLLSKGEGMRLFDPHPLPNQRPPNHALQR